MSLLGAALPLSAYRLWRPSWYFMDFVVFFEAILHLELETDLSEDIESLLLLVILELESLLEMEALDSYDLLRSSFE